jgi:hypothetical protein
MELGKRSIVMRAVLCAGLGAGCGKPASDTPAVVSGSGQEAPASESRDELSVSGLRGTLSQSEIQNALAPRMPKFGQCVQKRNGELGWISGHLALEFHVALDGQVSTVYPRESSLGDRSAERCIVELAQATRFPAPHGGEADFSWSLDVPLDDSVREPVALASEHVAAVIEQNRALIDATCGGGNYTITAYIEPSGKLATLGAAAADAASALNLDCVIETIEAFVFASPGSYVAKVSFQLP